MKVQVLFLVAILSLALKHLVKGQPWKNCSPRCGNIDIEFPFGTSTVCYYPGDRSFNLKCREDNRLFFGDFEVVSTSHSGELRILLPISYTCYNDRGGRTNGIFYNFTLSSFTLSDNNSFTGVGCDSSVLLTNLGDKIHSTGCISLCSTLPEKGSCSGEGCCQTSIPKGGTKFQVRPNSYDNHIEVYPFNRCTYAFLVEKDKFNFSGQEDLKNLRGVKKFPVVLDWSIGNKTCEQVGNNSICGRNSNCSDSTTRTGYICKCLQGFDGNPFLPGGCRGYIYFTSSFFFTSLRVLIQVLLHLVILFLGPDIDECDNEKFKHNCSDPKTCKNTFGSFTCECPFGNYTNGNNVSCVAPLFTPEEVPKYFGWSQIFLGMLSCTHSGFCVS